MSIINDRKFNKYINIILRMSPLEAVNYINCLEVSHYTFWSYMQDYLYYNPALLSKEQLQEITCFFNKIKKLHYFEIEKKDLNDDCIDLKVKNIAVEKDKISQKDYMENRYLLEEYVNNEEYVFTIIKKYVKDYNFFMKLVATAFYSNNSYDKELFEKVSNLLATKEYKIDTIIENIYPLLKGYIEEGVECENERVPFTIFDYYANFNLPIEYFLLYKGEKIEQSKIEYIILFFKKNYPWFGRRNFNYFKKVIPFNINYELKIEYTFDVNGKYVKPTLEEREQVMNYLVENKFPIDLIMYKQALRRYANGLLNINHQLKRTF